MIGKGNAMQESQIRTVISLLATTDMTIAEIAERMGCSRKTIVSINRRFQVRQYNGRRSSWVVSHSLKGMNKKGQKIGEPKPFRAHLVNQLGVEMPAALLVDAANDLAVLGVDCGEETNLATKYD
jgi:hypothetical protein